MGTLRLLVIRPVSRTRLLLVKFGASVIYTILLLVWMAVLALFLSMLLFGTNDMMIARNTVMEQIKSSDVLWRYIAAFGYAAVALSTVARTGLSFIRVRRELHRTHRLHDQHRHRAHHPLGNADPAV